MVVIFNASNQNKANLVASCRDAIIKCWGFFPFWIGNGKAGLEGLSTDCPGVNIDVRDGIYVVTSSAPGTFQPLVIPWKGPLFCLNNGARAGESVDNRGFFIVEEKC